VERTVQAIGGPSDRAVLLGSSLGGLAAARVAEVDARVCALVLLAPAFELGVRWRARLGESGWATWERTGWLEIDDHALKQKGRLDFGFAADVAAIEARSGGWPDVRVPTLIVHGVSDETIAIASSRAWAAGKPHMRLIEVDDGHELTASLPRIVAEVDRSLAAFWNAP
jgi:alpha-beta hydrolase superfamily lysophospholipase